MWREVHTEHPTETKMHVNVGTASHIKLKAVGDAWAVAVVHDGVESILEGTVGPAVDAETSYIELLNELNYLSNNNAIVARYQAQQIIESNAPKQFVEPRRIR